MSIAELPPPPVALETGQESSEATTEVAASAESSAVAATSSTAAATPAAPTKKPGPRKAGRRKINIEFIEDKQRRHITFSKRKAGIMKKAYELSTLTGTQVLLLVASETGHVYTFATTKLQPLITKPEGKNLIQACLNAPDVAQGLPAASIPRPQQTQPHPQSQSGQVYVDGNSNLLAYPQQDQMGDMYEKDKGDHRRSTDHSNRGFPSPVDVPVFPPSGYNSTSSNLMPGVRGMGYVPMNSRYSNLMSGQPPYYSQPNQYSAVPQGAPPQYPSSSNPYSLGWSGGMKSQQPQQGQQSQQGQSQQYQGIPLHHQMQGQDKKE